jgi:SAM-dependent methyltransferase
MAKLANCSGETRFCEIILRFITVVPTNNPYGTFITNTPGFFTEFSQMTRSSKEHWDFIYRTRHPEEVSWTELVPKQSLRMIQSLNVPKSASIIDVGGGDSRLVDYLLEAGFEKITVLDISDAALEKSKHRLGDKANKVNWIISDILEFHPTSTFDVWHDRALFHFLSTPQQIQYYKELLSNTVTNYVSIGTFSNEGPEKCSGLPVEQYNEEKLTALLKPDFEQLHCKQTDHTTPFGTRQNFLFCTFKRKGC